MPKGNLYKVLSIIAVLTILSPLSVLAEDKSGVKPSVISLPTGPGSIEGLGESFEPRLNSGTASYSVNITVPPGVAGHQPEFLLSYDGGSGNGPFGMGWSLTTPSIKRRTEKGIPGYSPEDTFVYYSGEELVPLADGTYRSENEGLFMRFSRQGLGWEIRDKNGSIYRLGLYPAPGQPNRISRIGKDTGLFDQVFAWYVDEIQDTNGNRIDFFYTTLPGSQNTLYLREIRYNRNVHGEYNAVIFDYEQRPDCLSNYRSGFKVRTGSRCHKISIYTRKTDQSSGTLVRYYKLQYELQPGDSLETPSREDISLRFSLLRKITQFNNNLTNPSYLPPLRFGYTRWDTRHNVVEIDNAPRFWLKNENTDLMDVNGDSLPDIVNASVNSGYYYYLNEGVNHQGVHRFQDEKSLSFPRPYEVGGSNAMLMDVNGDGLTDLLCKAGFREKEFYYYKNKASLTTPDEDLGISSTENYFENNQPFYLNSPAVRSLDLNADNNIDFMRTSAFGFQYFIYNEEQNTWIDTGLYEYGTAPLKNIYGSINVIFGEEGASANPSVHLADMNGDRLLDLVKLIKQDQYLDILYWPNMGNGYWDTRVTSDWIFVSGVSFERMRLMDVNQDGLSDLVILGNNLISYSVNLGEDEQGKNQWGHMQYIHNMPDYFTEGTVIREADMNGNGTKDLVYANGRKIEYYDFVGDVKPNLLSIIDNGIGRITKIDYLTSTDYYIKARLEGNPWKTRVPFPLHVVNRITIKTGLDLDGQEGPDEYITEISYRDGYYDSFEREFRGFGFAKKIEYGDDGYPTTVVRNCFHTGAPDGKDNDEGVGGNGRTDEFTEEGGWEDEPLKGKLLWSEVTGLTTDKDGEFADDNNVFKREINEWKLKTIHYAGTDLSNDNGLAHTLNEKNVVFAYKGKTEIQYIEKGNGAPKCVLETHEYDLYGNEILNFNHGVYPDGTDPDDELITISSFITDTDKWIVDRVYEIKQTDKNGDLVSHKQFFYDGNYDGEIYTGPGLGQIGIRGNVTRERAYVDDQKGLIDIEYKIYDQYGNIISTYDANNHKREILYDSVFNTFPEKEIIHLEGGKKLEIKAAYNPGFGTITNHWETNGNETKYIYDSFGRLVKIIKPGDSLQYPSIQYGYTAADPHRMLIYEYDSMGDLNLVTSSSNHLACAVLTMAREQSGQDGTFDTWKFSDGLGRTLAIIEEGETSNQFVVKEMTLFNARGTIRYAFLPYKASSSDYRVPSPSISKVETHYDATGREILQINPPDQDGLITQASTEYLPLEKIVTDENNNFKTFINDGLERLIEVHEKNDSQIYITRYEYDPLDNLTKITDAQNNIKTMEYDGLGRKTEMQDPDRGQMLYEYDDVGNLIKTTDNKGQVILCTYDAANRTLTEDYLDEAGITPDVTYYYDLASDDYAEATNLRGELSWIKDLSGALFFSYDQRGNVVWKIKRIDHGGFSSHYKISMTYDAMDRIVSMTYPDGEVIYYTFNNRALLGSIPGVVEDMSYTVAGKPISITYANGIKTHYVYDPRERLIQLETKSIQRENETLQHLTYILDGVTNITAIIDGRDLPLDSPQNASQTFQYDDLYRLTQAKGSGYGIINFQYDKIGNIILKKSPNAPASGHIDDPLINIGEMSYGGIGSSSNRSTKLPGDPPGPHAITSTESGLQYDYDDNGNMISHAQGDIYSWDFKDRLIRVQKEDTDTHYSYDYTGQRVIKRVHNDTEEKTVLYVSNEYEIRDDKVIKYVFAGDRRISRIEGFTPSADELEKQILTFYPGWNFFSLEIEPENPDIANVLSTIDADFTEVWAFDTLVNEYIGYVPDESMYDLTELHAQKGYLIKVISQTSLEITGTRMTNDIDMIKGWNLISCPSDTTLPVEEALASIEGKFVSIWSYDMFNAKWKCFNPSAPTFLNDSEIMVPGKAYWVEMKTDGQLAYVNRQTKMYFYHQDHLGSSNLITDMDGNVLENTEFYPFGRPRYEERADLDSAYKYTGKELDKESGLMYYGARYYDPVVGRFVSVDPLGPDWSDPQTIHRYMYCKNNPLKFLDPKGLQEEIVNLRVDFMRTSLHLRKEIWASTQESWQHGNYGRAALKYAAFLLNDVNVIASFVCQSTIGFSWNAGVDYGSGFMRGDWNMLMRGSVNMFGLGLIGKLSHGASRLSRGLRARLSRAPKSGMIYGKNWRSGSLSKAISRHAGSKATSWITKSGKKIWENPTTGRQVVYDLNRGYFRIFQPNRIGGKKGTYLNMMGKEVRPAFKTSQGTRNIHLRDVNKGLWQQETHFWNVD